MGNLKMCRYLFYSRGADCSKTDTDGRSFPCLLQRSMVIWMLFSGSVMLVEWKRISENKVRSVGPPWASLYTTCTKTSSSGCYRMEPSHPGMRRMAYLMTRSWETICAQYGVFPGLMTNGSLCCRGHQTPWQSMQPFNYFSREPSFLHLRFVAIQVIITQREANELKYPHPQKQHHRLSFLMENPGSLN